MHFVPLLLPIRFPEEATDERTYLSVPKLMGNDSPKLTLTVKVDAVVVMVDRRLSKKRPG